MSPRDVAQRLGSRLAYKFAAASAAITLAVVLMVGGLAYRIMDTQIRANVAQMLDNEATIRSQLVGQLFGATSANLDALAGNSLVANALVDSEGRDIYLKPFLNSLNAIDDVPVQIVLTDFRGVPLAGTKAPSSGDSANRPLWPWLEGAIAAGRPVAVVVSGGGPPSLVLMHPVIYADTGTPEGALMFRLPLAAVAGRFASGQAGLDTTLVLDGPEGEIAVPMGGTPSTNGGDVLTTSRPVAAGPAIAALHPRVVVDGRPGLLSEPLDRLALGFVGIGLGVVLVVVGGSLMAGRRATAPLRALATAAAAYRFGAAEPFRCPRGGTDEIALLGRAFTEMVDRLDAAYRELAARSRRALDHAERIARLGSWSWDFAGDGWIWSEQMFRVLGYEPDSVEPSRAALLAVCREADRAALAAALESCRRDGRPVAVDFRIPGPDPGGDGDRILHVQAEAIRGRDGGLQRVDGTAQDDTERRRLEARLTAAVADLRRSNEDLEQFAYVASHDLRQPLRMVSSYVTLLERNYAAALDNDAREFIAFARDGAKRMDRLIVDLLEYSRIGRRREGPREVPLGAAVADAVANLAPAVEEAGATVTVQDGLPTVVGERMELVRLFQNLIGNALEYRHPDRTPAIAVEWRDDGAEWRVSVRDNGIGIAPEYFDRIFLIFQRLHSREAYEGTGIGLAACRKIADHHGGRVWLESEEGVGSVFHVALPKAAAVTARAAAAPPPPAPPPAPSLPAPAGGPA